MADRIEASLKIGQATRLKGAGTDFFAVHTEADKDAILGGIILLHGIGAHPDWEDVINPLRTKLSTHGWETLSLQMPTAGPGATIDEHVALVPEAFPRIDAAIDFFKGRKIKNIVVIGHSQGAHTALIYLGEKKPKDIKAFVAVSLSVDAKDEKAITALKSIKQPILDIYGSLDNLDVMNGSRLKRQSARHAGNQGYRQTELLGANHFFIGRSDTLVLRIRGWLNKNAPNDAPGNYQALRKAAKK